MLLPNIFTKKSYKFISLLLFGASLALIAFSSTNGVQKQGKKYKHPYLRNKMLAQGVRAVVYTDTLFKERSVNNQLLDRDTLNQDYGYDTLYYDQLDRLSAVVRRNGRYNLYYDSMAYTFDEKGRVATKEVYAGESKKIKSRFLKPPYYRKNYRQEYSYHEDGRLKTRQTFDHNPPPQSWKTEFIYDDYKHCIATVNHPVHPQVSKKLDTIPNNFFYYNGPSPFIENIELDDRGSFLKYHRRQSSDTVNNIQEVYIQRHYHKVRYK